MSKQIRLIEKRTGREVKLYDTVTMERTGEEVVVHGINPPRHAGSTGKVRVTHENWSFEREFFPGVVGCEFREESDR
jgi:hypothetical protein